jgi:hypothetical protein
MKWQFGGQQWILIRFSPWDTGEKWDYTEIVRQLFIDVKKASDSVRREVLYAILIEFGMPMKLVRLIEMCLNETYSKVHVVSSARSSYKTRNQNEKQNTLVENFADFC